MMTTISSVVLSIFFPSKIKTAQRRHEFPNILNIKKEQLLKRLSVRAGAQSLGELLQPRTHQVAAVL